MAGFQRSDLIDKTGAVSRPATTPIAKQQPTQQNKPAQSTAPGNSDSPVYTPHVRGATFSVLDKLDNISFVDGTVGGMSATTAYIRYWSRNGVEQRVKVEQKASEQAVPRSQFDSISEELYGKGVVVELDQIRSGVAAGKYDTTWEPDKIKWDSNVDWSIATVSTTQQLNPPPKGATSVPTNTYITKPALAPSPSAQPSRPQNFFEKLLGGAVFSANPSGLVESATPTAPITDAAWQFLFNPEELQLESGPDYNRAETWGVSDPANSGQPLSWRSNKNRKLVFGKVLLHGYTFGKRVESLEKGLQDLFMARDGENGADGPPVLEFVWGKRVFGPCVIQNIRVREQSWDHGVLVNAEVSFELEQVPEWTINDGFADITRPGRQPVVNDPALPARSTTPEQRKVEEGENSKGNEEGGGGGKPSFNRTEMYVKCKEMGLIRKNFEKLSKTLEGDKNGILFINLGGIYDYTRYFKSAIGLRLKMYKEYYIKGSELFGKEFTDRLAGWSVADMEKRISARLQVFSLDGVKQAYSDLIEATFKAIAACKNIQDSQKCKQSQQNEKEYTTKKKRQKLCAIKAGSLCSLSGVKLKNQDRWKNPCTNKVLICEKDGKFREAN